MNVEDKTCEWLRDCLYFLWHFIVGEEHWFLFWQQLFTIYGIHASFLVDYGYASHEKVFWIQWQNLCILQCWLLPSCTPVPPVTLFGFSCCPQLTSSQWRSVKKSLWLNIHFLVFWGAQEFYIVTLAHTWPLAFANIFWFLLTCWYSG